MVPVLFTAPYITIIDHHPDLAVGILDGLQLFLQTLAVFQHFSPLLIVPIDGENHNVARRQTWWEHETIIITVGHQQRTDQARGDAPRGRPGIHLLAVLVLKLDFLGTSEVLAQEVRRARLQCFAVLHHRFNTQRADGTWKPLAGRFFSLNDRHRHELFGKTGIHIEHQTCFIQRLLFGGVGSVPLLP